MSDEEYQEFELDLSQYGFVTNDEDLNLVVQQLAAQHESAQKKAERVEYTRKNITAKESEYCRKNNAIFIVIPSGNGFERFIISRDLFPSSFFFGKKQFNHIPVVPEDDTQVDMNTAYMCFPDTNGKYHNSMPKEEVLKLIYPSRKRERDLNRQHRDANGKHDPEQDRRDRLMDEADEENKCVICLESDAQLRCMRLKCAGLFCEACYNKLRFTEGDLCACPACRRYF